MTAPQRPLSVSDVIGLIKKFDMRDPRPVLGSLSMGLEGLVSSYGAKPEKEKAYIAKRFGKFCASDDIHTRLLAGSLLQKITRSYGPMVALSKLLRSSDLPPTVFLHAFHGFMTAAFDGAAHFTPREKLKLDRHCRQLYRALFKKSASVFADDIAPIAALAGEDTHKIALCTGQFIGRRHAPTAHILSMADVLTGMGYQVKIFNQSLTPLRSTSGFYFPYAAPKFKDLNSVDALSLNNGKTVAFWQNPHDDVGQPAIASFTEAFCAFDPGCIISLGPANLFADLAGLYVPHASMPTTVDIAVGESGSYGCVRPLSALQQRVLRPLGISPDRLTALPSGFARPDSDGPVPRGEFHLSDSDYAVAIVTNRAHSDLTKDFIGALNAALKKAPHIKVGIFGSTGPLSPGQKRYFENHPNMTFHGYAPDLHGVLSGFNAVLNPPRQGGGTSAAYAMDLGLNLFTLDDCDVSNVAGPDFVYPDQEALLSALVSASTDPEGTAVKASLAKKRWTEISDREGQMRLLMASAQKAVLS